MKYVDEYIEEFYQLVTHNDLFETEEQLVAHHLGGLQQPLQDILSLHYLWIVSEAYQHTLVVEKQQTKWPCAKGWLKHTKVRLQEICPTQQPTQVQSSNANIQCFKFRKPSHRATECRNSPIYKGKNLLINEDDTEDVERMRELIYDKDGKEGVILHQDGNETLVVRRSLRTPNGDSGKDWLRTNIFHTICIIFYSVCKLIRDNGSCENMISKEAVQKL